MEWIELENSTKEQKKEFNEVDQNRIILFYDTREVAWYTDEKLPRAIVTHYLIVPEFPVKNT